jgi:putative AlgH/UPF0301 family transcriptional regulator
MNMESREELKEMSFYEKHKIEYLSEKKDSEKILFLKSFLQILSLNGFDNLMKIKMVVGNSQWYPGQLSGEMEAGSWLIDGNISVGQILNNSTNLRI